MRKRVERRPITVVHHPSGRPIVTERKVYLPQQRIPEEEALTPRLRRDRQQTEVIGFTVPFLTAPEDDE